MIALARQVLAVPALFDAYQAGVGANRAKRLFVDQWLRPLAGERLLDIGCGTGAVIPFLPEGVETVGVDISSAYIAASQARHGDKARFLVADASDPSLDLGGEFDAAYAFGVLHHLPDEIAARLVAGAMRRLRPGGRFVTIDPTLIDGQGAVSRFIVKSDRGRHVRTPTEMARIFEGHDTRLDIRTDLLRIPFANVIAVAVKPAHTH